MLPTTDWRERTEFLEKRALYVFSVELNLAFDVTVSPARVRAVCADAADVDAVRKEAEPDRPRTPSAESAATYHVLNDELTTTVDGAVHELPLWQVVELQDWLVHRGGGVFDLNGRARLVTDDQAIISLRYGGVVRLGFLGPKAITSAGANATGTAQIVTRYEVDRPKYRWLTQAQFVGFGEATVSSVKRSSSKILTLSADLYSAV